MRIIQTSGSQQKSLPPRLSKLKPNLSYTALKALKKESRAISIKSDCLEVILALISTTQAPVEIRNLIDQIKLRSSDLNFISVVKVKREEVLKAYFLSTRARKE